MHSHERPRENVYSHSRMHSGMQIKHMHNDNNNVQTHTLCGRCNELVVSSVASNVSAANRERVSGSISKSPLIGYTQYTIMLQICITDRLPPPTSPQPHTTHVSKSAIACYILQSLLHVNAQ